MDDFNKKNNTFAFISAGMYCRLLTFGRGQKCNHLHDMNVFTVHTHTSGWEEALWCCSPVKPVSTSAELVNWFCHYWTVKVHVDVFHSVIEKVKIIHRSPYDLESMDGISEARMSHFVKHLLHQLFFKSPTHISGWTDTDNVKTYFDVSLEEK